MADTGFKNPTACGSVYNEWTNPTNAYSSNNTYALATTYGFSNKEDYYNFDLGVPGGATIDGVEVSLEGQTDWWTSGSSTTFEVKLSYDGGTNWTAVKTATNWGSTLGDQYDSIGGAADNWGRTWSDTDFSDANFRVHFQCTASSASGCNVDHVRVKVYYTGGTTTSTSSTSSSSSSSSSSSTSSTSSSSSTSSTSSSSSSTSQTQTSTSSTSSSSSSSSISTSTSTSTTTLAVDTLFFEDFETGDTSKWTATTGTVMVVASPVLQQVYCLQSSIDTTSISNTVQKDFSIGYARIRCRFYFDPNSIIMTNGESLRILLGRSEAWNYCFSVVFRYQTANGYQIQAIIDDDSGSNSYTSGYDITDALHYIEIDWKAALTAGANDGYIQLWIDGVNKETVSAIDNDLRSVQKINMGCLDRWGGTSTGYVYTDQIKVTSSEYIGAEGFTTTSSSSTSSTSSSSSSTSSTSSSSSTSLTSTSSTSSSTSSTSSSSSSTSTSATTTLYPSCGNLLSNPSFETTGSWVKGGTTVNVTFPSSEQGYDGSNSVKVSEVLGNCYIYQDIAVSEGQTLKLSAYVYISSITSGGLWIKLTDTSFTSYAQSAGTTTVGSWVRETCSYTVEVGVTSVRVVLDSYGSATLTGYFDAIMLENSASVSTYCPSATSTSTTTISTSSTSTSTTTILTTSTSTTTTLGPIVSVSDGEFVNERGVFKFIGVNNYPLIWDEYSQAQLNSFFQCCVNDGIKVVRTWCYNKADEPINGSGFNRYLSGTTLQWREAWFQKLDLVLARARVYGVKLVLPLVDNWPQYNNWGTKQQYCYWSNTIYGTLLDRYNQGNDFFLDANIKTWFKQYIAKLCGRTNTVNGVAYLSDPTIFSWELGNELRFDVSTDYNTNTLSSYKIITLTAWKTEMANYIKTQDPNHMVGSGGSEQFYDWVANDWVHNGSYYGQDYTTQHQINSIDYFDFHQYAYNDDFTLRAYGVYAGHSSTASFAGWEHQIHDYVDIAKANGKPVVIGEWGVDKRNTTATPLDAYPKEDNHLILFNTFFNRGGDGIILWHYTNLFDDNNYNIKPDGVHTGGNANGNLNDDDSELRNLISTWSGLLEPPEFTSTSTSTTSSSSSSTSTTSTSHSTSTTSTSTSSTSSSSTSTIAYRGKVHIKEMRVREEGYGFHKYY